MRRKDRLTDQELRLFYQVLRDDIAHQQKSPRRDDAEREGYSEYLVGYLKKYSLLASKALRGDDKAYSELVSDWEERNTTGEQEIRSYIDSYVEDTQVLQDAKGLLQEINLFMRSRRKKSGRGV